jgi:hypothetical protein
VFLGADDLAWFVEVDAVVRVGVFGGGGRHERLGSRDLGRLGQ